MATLPFSEEARALTDTLKEIINSFNKGSKTPVLLSTNNLEKLLFSGKTGTVFKPTEKDPTVTHLVQYALPTGMNGKLLNGEMTPKMLQEKSNALQEAGKTLLLTRYLPFKKDGGLPISPILAEAFEKAEKNGQNIGEVRMELAENGYTKSPISLEMNGIRKDYFISIDPDTKGQTKLTDVNRILIPNKLGTYTVSEGDKKLIRKGEVLRFKEEIPNTKNPEMPPYEKTQFAVYEPLLEKLIVYNYSEFQNRKNPPTISPKETFDFSIHRHLSVTYKTADGIDKNVHIKFPLMSKGDQPKNHNIPTLNKLQSIEELLSTTMKGITTDNIQKVVISNPVAYKQALPNERQLFYKNATGREMFVSEPNFYAKENEIQYNQEQKNKEVKQQNKEEKKNTTEKVEGTAKKASVLKTPPTPPVTQTNEAKNTPKIKKVNIPSICNSCLS